jgi:pimeloyl-ACP methyl ester carboxylesterase
VKKLRKKNHNRIKVKATSLTALLVSVLILSALAGVQFIEEVAAIDYTQYTGTLDDADFALRIPDAWNGMLVIICRGYSNLPAMINPLLTILAGNPILEQGFAVAASSYGSDGFCVQAGVDSTYELTMYVIDNYNVTGKVFLYGISMGGAIALLLGEKYPYVYSGVLDMYGVKDLKEMYNDGVRWGNMSIDEIEAELTALGASIPPPFSSSLEQFKTNWADLNNDIINETGGTPETHPQAYEDISPTYHANIMIPVITVHGTADASVRYVQSLMYQTAVANAGRSDIYRLYNVTGGQHASTEVNAEVSARFDELVAWAEIIPEDLTVGVMLLLSTVAAIVGICILRKRPKWKRW